MSRRRDPDRIYEARREEATRRLEAMHYARQTAEARVAEWEASDEAAALERGSPDFWRHGHAWIVQRLQRPRGSSGRSLVSLALGCAFTALLLLGIWWLVAGGGATLFGEWIGPMFAPRAP